VDGAFGKLEEELGEFKEAMVGQKSDEILEEFGDCLFSLVNVGRKLGISSEMALLGTIHKFRTRFSLMEHQAVQQNLNIEDLSLTELDQLWEQAKQELKQRATHENHKNSVNQQRAD
ncbi:MAG TPA: nucleoside triphosphate pyrophosphohydrolase, partial [Acinetobacter schindleri]|nr:nucleoside triphosphate pyrophosphohydrolase [Acinetobacter schindleri]